MEAPRAHCSCVAIFYCEVEHFSVKELRLHGPNFISFQLVTGRRRWYIVRYYITPSDASAIEDVTATVRSQLYGYDLLMAGKLNANLAELEGTPRVEAIAGELV